MRRFFSFRSSSAPGGGKESPAPLPLNVENAVKKTVGSSHLRRSFSFSSPVPYDNGIEGKCNSSSGLSVSPSDCSNVPHQASESPIHCRSLTPGRLPNSKRHDEATVRKTHAFETLDSPRSSGGHHGSRGNSPDSPPVSLRCRSSRVTQFLNTNNILDLYIDGVQQEASKTDSIPHTAIDGCLADKRPLPSFGWPPRALSTPPASPIYSKECLRSHSFREEKDISHHLTTRDLSGNGFRCLSPKKHSRKITEWQSCALSGNAKVKSPDDDSQTTTTVEDIFEKSSNSTVQKCALSDHIPADDCLNGHCTEETLSCNDRSHILWDASMDIRRESSRCLWQQNEDVDAELLKKLEEAVYQITLPPGIDANFCKLQSGSLCPSELVQMIRDMLVERKNLLSKISSQIRCRISERSSTKKALKQAQIDLDMRTRRLEKEKDELQSNLERELDRRSTDWSLKLEKFQAEEERLGERVRELAEQNVSLQREVSSLSGREMEGQSRVMNSETRLNELTMMLEELRNENVHIQHALCELKEQSNMAKADQDTIKRNYKEKEKEANELQKAVVNLRRICSEQEKTITGLRQGYADEIEKQSQEGVDLVSKLQMEHIRLTAVEQSLRTEVESSRLELESLRRENLCIVGRIRCAGSGCGPFLFRLDQELHAQIEHLQSQALSLLDDGDELCSKLLSVINSKQCEFGHVTAHEFDGFSVLECSTKLRSLKTAVKDLRRRLKTISTTLDERSNLEALEYESQNTESGLSRKYEGRERELRLDEIELELKAESLLARALRDKLCYKELELEQLQSELASSIRGNESLKYEIQRLQNDLACLTHKLKDMELQMLKKDEKSSERQHDLEECMKELTISRDMLPRVSEERDHLWEEVKQSRETNMLLDFEVKSLKKKIEALEEDSLIKEGQITILKDSLGKAI